MKKLLIVLLVALLSLSFVACSGTVQYIDLSDWKAYDYEKLTYTITEEGSELEGTLTMEMEELDGDVKYDMPVVDATQKKVVPTKIDMKKNYFILTRTLSFPTLKGGEDVMYNVTLTDDRFNPLYSFASLVMADEQVSYTGTGDAPDCVTYFTSSKYTQNKDNSKWNVTSTYLRQLKYGELDTTKWFTKTQTFENLEENSSDMNLLYYNLRFINNLTDTDDFTYKCSVPMALESTIKTLNCTGAVEQYAVDDRIPYVYNEYKAIGENYGGFGLDLVKVNIFLTNQSVTGSGIAIYYSRAPMLAKEEIPQATSENLTTLSKDIGSYRVPVMIVENSRPSTTSSLYPDSRGTITYRLREITNQK